MTSFTPDTRFGSASLLGVGVPIRYHPISKQDVYIPDIRESPERGIHPSDEEQKFNSEYIHTVIIILISAVIFVTAVALYEVIRVYIGNYYANTALNDPESSNTLQDITRIRVANQATFTSTVIFAFICLISALILVPILIYLDKKY